MMFHYIILQGRSTFAKPHDSTQGLTLKAQLIIFTIAIIVIGYIIFRVWRAIKKEKNK
ncbi:MAG: hypothetical protein JNL24_08700 [Bacteroidia bacterium]|nr:hypothetical protein [Bacteroidia bacterium]